MKLRYLKLLVVEVVGEDGLQGCLGEEPPQFGARAEAGARGGAEPEGATELDQAVLDTRPPAPALTSVEVIITVKYIYNAQSIH